MPQPLRPWLFVLLMALGVSVSSELPLFNRADGLSIDSLYWLRHHLFGPNDPADSAAVVIAIDEETYRRPPFRDIPKAMWTPQLAQVIESTLDAGALVIGQDLILPTSVERYLQGYDRSYLLALRRGAKEGRLVLGKVQHLRKPLAPFSGHSFAVGHQKNIRLVNLFRDADGVIRRVPLSFSGTEPDGSARIESAFALELAARAVGVRPHLANDGGPVELNGYRIPGSEQNAMLLNFETGGGGVPTYSFADLYHCAEAGRVKFFEAAFKDKVVLIGAVLDVEDRKLTSKRFVTGPEIARTKDRCVVPVMEELYDARVVRDTIPGVYVFATAVNNLLRREALSEPPWPARAGLVLLFGLCGGACGLRLRPAGAAIVTVVVITLWAVVATTVFRAGLVLPMIDAGLAAVLGLMAAAGYRFGVTDQEKRAVRKAFGYFLPSVVIDRMLIQGTTPQLGGETRDVTILFSDLADFTSLSEALVPADVVRLMNCYLAAMTQVIEAHGGFVDKYIGDAIMAVFGAPLDDPKHPRHAVEAALECQGTLARLQPDLGLPEGHRLVARIGINSGPVVIGNIGSEKRLNYTVMGDNVNLAARLEGVNKLYGTGILASAETAQRCGTAIAFREIDRVRVIGRADSITICEPRGAAADRTSEDIAQDRVYTEALTLLRKGDWTTARSQFETLAARDPTAGKMAAYCKTLIDAPPAPDWSGVRDLDRK